MNRHRDECTNLRDKYNARNEEARNCFMQIKIGHTLDGNSNGVWRELRNLVLLPKQHEQLHGISPDALNSRFKSTTDARVNEDCLDIISKTSKNGEDYFLLLYFKH